MTEWRLDDAARLRAVRDYGVADLPSGLGLDTISSLAAQICSTPTALVTFVDDVQQYFRGRFGFGGETAPFDAGFCPIVVQQGQPVVIPDTAADDRHVDNPAVRENGVRFYAGVPLLTPGGQALGTVCVLDQTPRPAGLTDAQLAALRGLATQVVTQLELRRAVAERETDRVVALAEAARLEAMIATQQAVATAKADLATVFQAIVDGALRVVDHADGAVVELQEGDELVYASVSGELAKHQGIRLPMDRTLSGRAVREERPLLCSDTWTDASVDRTLTDQLGIRSMIVVPVTRRGEPVGALKVQSRYPDAFSARDVVMTQMLAGLVASGFGDVAEVRSKRLLRKAEGRYRQTFDSVTQFAVIVTDPTGTVTEWNSGAERIMGWTADEMIGRSAETFFTPEDCEQGQARKEMAASLREGRGVDERWHLMKDGTRFWASGEMMPVYDDAGQHSGFVKVLRDRTDQHLAGVRLEELQTQLAQAQTAGGVGLFTVEIGSGSLTATEEFSRLFGLGHRERRPAQDFEDLVVPDDREFASNDLTRHAGDAPQDVEYRIRRADTGEERWIARKGGFQLNDAGQPMRFSGIARDVTVRKATEFRHEALRRLGDTLLGLDDADAMSRAADEIVGRALGVHRVGYGSVDADGETFIVPSDWTAEGYPSLAGTYRISEYGSYADDLRAGRTVVIPDIRLDPRTADNPGPLADVGVRTLVNLPVVENGRTVAILYVNDDRPRDWTADEVAFLHEAALRTRTAIERRRAEGLLRESDERQRIALTIGEIGTFDLDLATGAVLLDTRARAAFGILDGRTVTQDQKLGAIHPEDQAMFDAAVRAAMAGHPFDLQFRTLGLDDGALRWVAVQGRSVGGSRLIGAVRDVSDRVAADERREVLNRELAHRLKNTLAIVQSIATQTLRIAPDMTTARKALTDRIGALSRAHDILLTGRRDAGDLRAIIEAAVALHDSSGRVRLQGPDIEIGPKAALTLSLIVHELATNAGKYGALSAEGGHVDVEWKVTVDPVTRRPDLVFEWREVGGPLVAMPERRSFGSRLIEMGLSGSSGGTSEIEYAPAGVRCRITASLTELKAEDEAGD